jgi:Helix-turn-helix domain
VAKKRTVLSVAVREKTLSQSDPTIDAERERIARALMSVLRMTRQDADLSQRDMGERLGYSDDVVSNMESLRTPISFADTVLWVRQCRLDEAELFEQLLFTLRKRKPRSLWRCPAGDV